jgi:hypothetical protein
MTEKFATQVQEEFVYGTQTLDSPGPNVIKHFRR